MSLRWVPNAICIVRILLVAPIISMLLDGRFGVALSLIVIAGVSDAIDGYLAKHFGWRTRIGGLLDPAADKLLVTGVFFTLTYLGLVPLLLTAVVVTRDLVIVVGVLVYRLWIGTVKAAPTKISKLNTACQLMFLVMTVTHAGFGWPPDISLTVLGASIVFTSVTSGLNYVLGWSQRAWRVRHESA